MSPVCFLETQHTHSWAGWWRDFQTLVICLENRGISATVWAMHTWLWNVHLGSWRGGDVCCCVLHNLCALHTDSFLDAWMQDVKETVELKAPGFPMPRERGEQPLHVRQALSRYFSRQSCNYWVCCTLQLNKKLNFTLLNFFVLLLFYVTHDNKVA